MNESLELPHVLKGMLINGKLDILTPQKMEKVYIDSDIEPFITDSNLPYFMNEINSLEKVMKPLFNEYVDEVNLLILDSVREYNMTLIQLLSEMSYERLCIISDYMSTSLLKAVSRRKVRDEVRLNKFLEIGAQEEKDTIEKKKVVKGKVPAKKKVAKKKVAKKVSSKKKKTAKKK
jgi:hypothetical protein